MDYEDECHLSSVRGHLITLSGLWQPVVAALAGAHQKVSNSLLTPAADTWQLATWRQTKIISSHAKKLHTNTHLIVSDVCKHQHCDVHTNASHVTTLCHGKNVGRRCFPEYHVIKHTVITTLPSCVWLTEAGRSLVQWILCLEPGEWVKARSSYQTYLDRLQQNQSSKLCTSELLWEHTLVITGCLLKMSAITLFSLRAKEG